MAEDFFSSSAPEGRELGARAGRKLDRHIKGELAALREESKDLGFHNCVLHLQHMLLVVALTILVFGGTETKAVDTNAVFDPCTNAGQLKRKDAISIGVGLAGERSSWYNNSDTNPNILSLCSSKLAASLSQSAVVTVFRPIIEQIGQLEMDNASYVQLRDAFPGNASLIVYAGRNPTIVSEPRYFLHADGRVPELTLDLHFDDGRLSQLL